ncbi:hypothetical protein M409DRAFT_18429 [Zasmidium cellare ATCC 36951]|uniref:Uncharacterized protein n=1 Tax=Zasmidium cellare ATCC 36951 TaxID=1080233 RepID=A0A6A6CWB2_ZASCE|nr:uncharacterized protein M409DRAFT_18429 [Zasmidium cellare ATCC 36951]KAF2171315.1 hypothetical protein M409DRAFT_18429 [Zasmidium cellare ATCC 36951]
MASVCLVGATGLVGSHIFNTLKSRDGVSKIFAYSRKELAAGAKVSPIVSKESAEWPKQYPSGAQLFISALGTTRANAGGFENQKKIDYELNLELAKAAQAAGTKVYVLISTAGADSQSMMGYPKMKGELEDAVKALEFEHVVIVRPGLIVGTRSETRTAEFVLRKIAGTAGAVSNKLKDFWAQDDEVIARAAVKAGLDCAEGKEKETVRILAQSDIVRLGRTEWK